MNNLTEAILQVLQKYKQNQINLHSESARKKLAEEISLKIKQTRK
tara:strand:- start:1406 stop:1540 length:135 start_codon:yes stop_codon:yes gene_type:complete